ncbi:hypothetical protein K437DRAFT_151639 [Tilletiaria anomala UBC 951]|uniref:RRM domain-containing protein n=1 Tax=Tilletiaria anomala (strain ATCC 24038 / CBS 436.72 / UBC 951) TaxID=1037660 RepID=A0A066VTF2_TILAU|nr:uncharacterized protein K437DRAFT_151639 [Tilletiaria anomala UBC 951]KDN43553.1 hypothetical protein K437DRAFT_151639 [Tilletiaria anomala UBC 951]
MNRHHPYGGYDARPAGRGGSAGRGLGQVRGPTYSHPAQQHQQQQAVQFPQDAYGAPGPSSYPPGPEQSYAYGGSGGANVQASMGISHGGMNPHAGMPPAAPPSYGYGIMASQSAPYGAPGPSQAPVRPPYNAGGGGYAGPPPAHFAPAAPPALPYPGAATGFDHYAQGQRIDGPPMNMQMPPATLYEQYSGYGGGGVYGSEPTGSAAVEDVRPRDGRKGRQEARGISRKETNDLKEERMKKERPGRTLFLRNIDFDTDPAEVQARFRTFGEITKFFDLTGKRGLAFCTYYDIRAAEAAKAAMQDFEFNGRKLDIHYSLPKEEDQQKRCDRDKNQGTLFVLLRKGSRALQDADVYQVFLPFGEIKSIRRYKDQSHTRFLEFYDSRACQAAHDSMNGTKYLDGEWDLKFAWDLSVAAVIGTQGGQGPAQGRAQDGRGRGGGGGSSARGPQQQQQQQMPAGLQGSPPHLYRVADARVRYPGPGPFAQVPPAPPVAATGTGASPTEANRSLDPNRLEQAQKVQQLLASLKTMGAVPAPSQPHQQATPTNSCPVASLPPPAQLASAPASVPVSAATAQAPSSLPANLAALLGSLQASAQNAPS